MLNLVIIKYIDLTHLAKIFEIITPLSEVDSDYENFEYLLRWIGRDGSDYCYMFHDMEIETRVGNEPVNLKDPQRIKSLSINEERSFTVFVEDISKNDLQVFEEMLINQYVTRIKKDESIERYAVDSNRFRYTLKNGRYRVEINLIKYQRKSWS